MTNPKMLADLMRQAQAFQEKLTRLREELGQRTVEASAGGGMVTAVVNGRQELLSLQIDPEVMASADRAMLQDLVLAAVNEALRKSRAMVADEMKGMTGGLPIPGLF